MHATVASLVFQTGASLLQIGENDDASLNEHSRRAVGYYRKRIETLLSATRDQVHPDPLTVEEVCSQTGQGSLHPSIIRSLIKYLTGLAMHYMTCAGADIPLNSPDETLDLFYFVGLGVAIAIRSLGSGHEFTKRWAQILKQLTGVENPLVDWRSNPMEDPPEALENIVDAWLAGGFRCLYTEAGI
jgi:hypothetical protein